MFFKQPFALCAESWDDDLLMMIVMMMVVVMVVVVVCWTYHCIVFTSLKAALNCWLFIVDSGVQNSALRLKFIAYEPAQIIWFLPVVWQCSICVVCRCLCRTHVFIAVPKTVTLKAWELFELCVRRVNCARWPGCYVLYLSND